MSFLHLTAINDIYKYDLDKAIKNINSKLADTEWYLKYEKNIFLGNCYNKYFLSYEGKENGFVRHLAFRINNKQYDNCNTIINNKNIITSIQTALDYVNGILKKLIDIFKSIDQYLTNCGAVSETTPLTSLNPYLQQLDQQQQEVQTASINQVYRGFVLEVREEQFSPTVSRRRAVALNPQGIVLLQTPLSFTSTPEVLVQQLKLIIDNSNLKAE